MQSTKRSCFISFILIGSIFVSLCSPAVVFAQPYGLLASTTVYAGSNISTYAESNYSSTPPAGQRNLYLGWDTLNGQYNKGNTRIYLRFDLPSLPDGAQITGAEAQVYQYSRSCSSDYKVDAYAIGGEWSEIGVTWNNQPGLGKITNSATFRCVWDWQTVDITDLVKSWYSGSSNWGIALLANPESATGGAFWSRACSDAQCPGGQRPRLRVDYTDSPITPTPTPTPTPAPTPSPVPTPTPDPNLKTWTFMLYLDGDNNLAYYLNQTINALEAQPQNTHINVVVLYDGDHRGDTVRFLLQSGGKYTQGTNKWSLDELNMGDPNTLSTFVTWAHDNYPSDYYYLSIADHGRGAQGIAWDQTSGNDYISTAELRSAINTATNSGAWKIDVLHLDACLMGLIEDAYQVKDYVNFLVASENLGWSFFAYDQYIQGSQPVSAAVPAVDLFNQVAVNTTPHDLAVKIADTYNTIFSQSPANASKPRTISALDLSKLTSVRQSVDTLSTALIGHLADLKNYISNTRSATQKFDSRNYNVCDQDDEYLDLYHLAFRLKAYVPVTDVQTAAQGVMDAIDAGLIVAEHHASGNYDASSKNSYCDLSNSHGISIYFPPQSGTSDYNRYISNQSFQFTQDSQWDEFLKDYFGVMGLPPDNQTDPGLPNIGVPRGIIYMPVITRR